ncbi:hypothetical protein RFI_39226, partial [Reticulomyxa filosa]
VTWEDEYQQTHKDPLNPYLTTLREGIQYFKDKFQKREHFIHGADELIQFICNSSAASYINNEDVLLHNLYKYLPHYPIIQVYWEIKGYFMVPYKRTISTQKKISQASAESDTVSPSDIKPKFNPLLYTNKIQDLKEIQNALHFKLELNNQLQRLLCEVIKNGYLTDLIPRKVLQTGEDVIKQQINYKENEEEKLTLNDKILTILKELKILYHDDIHKQMGYSLQLYHICAIVLYCGKSCNVQFSYDQIKFKHYLWPYLDYYLQEAIMILHSHERREEESIDLYCGLRGVRLENIEKEIKSGFFISHVSTSNDIQVAQTFRSDQGCILHFHPSMRRARAILNCDVSWISPYKHESEILFARSPIHLSKDENVHKEACSWNAKVESEDNYTQMILLTWTEYDKYITQVISFSSMFNSIDLNIIYVLLCESGDSMASIYIFLLGFQLCRDENIQKYNERKKEFTDHRCCNEGINLFFIHCNRAVQDYITKSAISDTAQDYIIKSAISDTAHCNPFIQDDIIKPAISYTVHNGLPFVEKDKKK